MPAELDNYGGGTDGRHFDEWFNAFRERTGQPILDDDGIEAHFKGKPYATMDPETADWDADTLYPKDSMVRHDGALYLSMQQTMGTEPGTNEAVWLYQIGGLSPEAIADITAGVEAAGAAQVTLAQARADEAAAQAAAAAADRGAAEAARVGSEAAHAAAAGLLAVTEAVAANAQASALTCATWAALVALSGSSAGQGAEVLDSDAGTHTDPVAGGTVANAGRYSWSVSPAGWLRIGGTGLSAKAPQVALEAEVTAREQADAAIAGLAALAEERAQEAQVGLDLAQARMTHASDRGRRESLDALGVALLAEERAQANESALILTAARFDALIARLETLEASQDTEMTTYAISATAGTAASVIVAAGPIQRIQLQNRSLESRVGIAFGSAPASLAAAAYVLEPGGALDTALIAATPIYIIADGVAQVEGAFAVPLNAPNPNWEVDFQAIIGRMVSNGAPTPDALWQSAYRSLYSAFRRENILSRVRGLYVLGAHASGAARINWAGAVNLAVAAGAPEFMGKQGYKFNGASYFTSGISLGDTATTLDASAGVWPGVEDQTTTAAAMGDGVFELQPNRSATEAGVRGWSGSTSVDTSVAPFYGSFLGAVRVSPDQFSTYLSGGRGEIETRAYISGYTTPRPVFIGATNNSTGVIDKLYNGVIRAAMFGQSLSAAQMLAAQAAMSRFFKEIEAI